MLSNEKNCHPSSPQVFEKLKNPSIYDHVRQSIFFYFIILYVLVTWIFYGFTGSEDDVYFLTGLAISIVAIVINYKFLFRIRQAKVT